MIDVTRVLGREVGLRPTPWSAEDVILYHLGIGAGSNPTDPDELALTYERGLRVLPSFAVVPAMPVAGEVLALPGLDVDEVQMLHGEQEVVVHRPLPAASTTARTSGRVAAVHDKGTAAVVVLETATADDDGPLFVNRYSMFLRGQGGFGGEPGPPSDWPTVDGPPDHEVVVATAPSQALLYRLSGDKNPLHVDPAVAAAAGFDRPILHGLCSLGITTKAVWGAALGGDPDGVQRLRARFTGVTVPGEPIEVRLWRGDDVVDALATTRGAPVLRARVWHG